MELRGKHNTAKVFTDNVESTAIGQIIELCNQEFAKDSKIRIMPDVHAGAGCTIGTTMTITDKIVPNLVGVDIGCGLEVAVIDINKKDIDFDELEAVITKHVPTGFRVNSKAHRFAKQVRFDDIKAPFNRHRAELSISSMGGGNHFLELNEWDDKVALVVHSGSRILGKQIAEHYQDLAYEELTNLGEEKEEIVKRLKKEGREKDIQKVLSSIKKPNIRKDLAYLEGDSFKDYMNDMVIAQEFALLNRKAMIDEVVSNMNWTVIDQFTTIHNYIDMEHSILRKGAISARKGERVIIPLNMRDGSIIATGKGNDDWNQSAPHGAGRLMSRSKAKADLSLEEFKDTMTDVWSTSVLQGTLDESPMAYKPMEEILSNVKDTLDIEKVIKPLYNHKAH